MNTAKENVCFAPLWFIAMNRIETEHPQRKNTEEAVLRPISQPSAFSI